MGGKIAPRGKVTSTSMVWENNQRPTGKPFTRFNSGRASRFRQCRPRTRPHRLRRGTVEPGFGDPSFHIRVSAAPLDRTAISQRRMPVLPRAQQVVMRGPSKIRGTQVSSAEPHPSGARPARRFQRRAFKAGWALLYAAFIARAGCSPVAQR